MQEQITGVKGMCNDFLVFSNAMDADSVTSSCVGVYVVYHWGNVKDNPV